MATESKKPERKKRTKKPEAVTPLKVEVNFPSITDLKQALAFDSDGHLIVAIQFKARVDQFEIFRLVNLLNQPHGTLYAIIGSPQSAMDFIFDKKQNRMDILEAASEIVAAKTDDKGNILPAESAGQEETTGVVTIQTVRFNHIPEEEKPYGVLIEYLVDGTGELKAAGGRGKTATEAVIAGVHICGAVSTDLKEPFEVRAVLEEVNRKDPSAVCRKLVRVIDVGSFDIEEGEEKKTGGKAA